MDDRKLWSWPWRRSLLSFLLVCTCWTLVGRLVLCKPTSSSSDTPWTSNDEAWARTAANAAANADLDELLQVGGGGGGANPEAVERLDQLRKTMETFKQLRLMLNERLLANGAAATSSGSSARLSTTGANPSADGIVDDDDDDDDDSDRGDLEEINKEKRRRNFVLLAAAMDESTSDASQHFVLKRADPDSPTPSTPRPGGGRRRDRDRQHQRRQKQRQRKLNKQRNQQQREDEKSLDTVADMERSMQADGISYQQQQLHGLHVTANMQQSMATGSVEALRLAQRQKEDSRLSSSTGKAEFECPKLHGKGTQVLCPSRRRGYRVCIPDTALCNGHADCPLAEDEDPVNCLFYKTTIHHFRLIVDAVVELSDVVKKHETRHGMDEL